MYECRKGTHNKSRGMHDKKVVRRRERGHAHLKAMLAEQGGGTHRWKKKRGA